MARIIKDYHSQDFLVKLDLPCHPSTHSSDVVAIKGRFISPKKISPSILRDKLDILIKEENGFSINSSQQCSGIKIKKEIAINEPYVEDLQILANEPNVYELRGKLNISSLVPEDEQSRHFDLNLVIDEGQWVGVSNTVHIELMPKSKWKEPLGGFLFPASGKISTNYLALRAWAVKKDDPLKSAEFFVKQFSLGDAVTSLWSPGINLSLPSFEESKRALFGRTFCRDDLLIDFNKKIDLNKPIEFSAHCEFESGAEIDLLLPRVLWQAERKAQLEGEIESFSMSADGNIKLEGWLFCSDVFSPSLCLEGARKQLKLTNSDSVKINWLERLDIESKYLSGSRAAPYGFRIEFHPLILGRFPGLVKLVAENNDLTMRTVLGPRHIWKKITTAIDEYAVANSFAETIAGIGIQIGSGLGIRKHFSTKKKPSELRSGKYPSRLLVSSHNLSMTEGAPKVLFQIMNNLVSKADSDTELLVVSATEGEGREAYERLGARVEVIPGLSMVGQTWERYHQSIESVAILLNEFKADSVYANVIDSFWAIDLANRIDLESFWLIHESLNPLLAYLEVDPRLQIQFLHRLSEANKMVFVAESTKEVYAPFLGDTKSVVIPNGVNINQIESTLSSVSKDEARKELGLTNDETVISIIGTTCPRKGQDVFLKEVAWFKTLMPEENTFKFLVVGARKGEFLDSLKKLKKDLELSELEFVLETLDIGKYYIASDIVVMASREESAPLVSLESFAYGVPLISTDVFGLKEQIRPDENALVFDIYEEGSLAKQLKRLINDKDLAKKLIKNAKADVIENFSLKTSLSAHLEEVLLSKS